MYLSRTPPIFGKVQNLKEKSRFKQFTYVATVLLREVYIWNVNRPLLTAIGRICRLRWLKIDLTRFAFVLTLPALN